MQSYISNKIIHVDLSIFLLIWKYNLRYRKLEKYKSFVIVIPESSCNIPQRYFQTVIFLILGTWIWLYFLTFFINVLCFPVKLSVYAICFSIKIMNTLPNVNWWFEKRQLHGMRKQNKTNFAFILPHCFILEKKSQDIRNVVISIHETIFKIKS